MTSKSHPSSKPTAIAAREFSTLCLPGTPNSILKWFNESEPLSHFGKIKLGEVYISQGNIEKGSKAKKVEYDIVGPVCETADFIGKKRSLCLSEGDLLAVFSVGAYGFSMASNYNSRPRPSEILVDNDQIQEIRKRESLDDLINGERLV